MPSYWPAGFGLLSTQIEYALRRLHLRQPVTPTESSDDMPALDVQQYGDTAVFIRCQTSQAARIAEACRREFPAAVDAWCGDGSVLMRFAEPIGDVDSLLQQLKELEIPMADAADHGVVTLPITYDGPDLDAVAQQTGMSVEAVIGRHSAVEYRVAFCGFSPGFAYLSGLDPLLVLPRRASPRAQVPTGSVAIAAQYSAVYPRSSPGGWHILGTCRSELFNAQRAEPALLIPGRTVRFEAR